MNGDARKNRTLEMNNELYHHGILGQKWGIRRFQNKDGTLTEVGRKRKNRIDARESNEIYRSLTKEERKLVTADDKPSNRFTDAAELRDYSVNTLTIYNKKKPISSVTVWKEDDENVALSVMTRNGYRYRNRGYGDLAVKKAIDWLENSDFKRAYWDVRADNTSSIKLAERNGFKYLRNNKNDPMWKLYVRDL